MSHRKLKNPFIVSWNDKDIKLSDGNTERKFDDHDEALSFLSKEIDRCKLPKANSISLGHYKVLQLQCSRIVRGIIYLYGVSDFFAKEDTPTTLEKLLSRSEEATDKGIERCSGFRSLFGM